MRRKMDAARRRNRLRQLLLSRFKGDRQKLQIDANLSKSHLSQLLNDHGSFGEKIARRIEDAVGLPQGWMDADPEAERNEPDLALGRVPLLAAEQAAEYEVHVDNSKPPGDDIESHIVNVPVHRHTFAWRVVGDSMEPDYREGMILTIEPSMTPKPGNLVLARLPDKSVTFKQLTQDGDIVYLKPLNGRYPIRPLGEATIIGVVRAATVVLA